jgi:hypothetical protein
MGQACAMLVTGGKPPVSEARDADQPKHFKLSID